MESARQFAISQLFPSVSDQAFQDEEAVRLLYTASSGVHGKAVELTPPSLYCLPGQRKLRWGLVMNPTGDRLGVSAWDNRQPGVPSNFGSAIVDGHDQCTLRMLQCSHSGVKPSPNVIDSLTTS